MTTTFGNLRDKLSSLRPRHWGLIAVGALLLWFAFDAEGNAVDSQSWSCESLIQPVIEMSEERPLTVLEISNPTESTRMYGPRAHIDCWASAEWSMGEGSIQYGAHVTDGGSVILEYAQR